MPSGWTVVQDAAILGHDLARIGSQMGTSLKTLRNTVYRVHGHRIQINTVTTEDTDAAQAVMEYMRSIKPEEFILQKDLIIYEFVCTDDALTDARAGRQHLAAR